MPVEPLRKLTTDAAAKDEARHQNVMSGMNAIANVAAAERAGDVAHEAMGKQESGFGGAIGSIAGSVIGSAVPGVGPTLGGKIGGGLGSLFG